MSNINNKQPLDLSDYDGISQPDVTTGNLCNSDEPSTTTLIIDPMAFLLDHNECSYEPLLVSIRPIHREDPKLKEFELLKECYLDDLLHRFNSTSDQKTLEACLLKVNNLMNQIRESYAGVKKKYSDSELATMMVMYGSFILEFCFNHEDKDLYLPNKMQNLLELVSKFITIW
ncbi:putative UPF0481 protein [Tanacetum coccineum]